MRAAGMVLAGGRSSRMEGRDKPLLPVGGVPLVARVLDRLGSLDAVAINANGDPAAYAGFGRPIIADSLAGHQGPLAGVLAGLRWAQGEHADILATLPGDTPFLPVDIAPRLLAGASGGTVAVARSPDRIHPVCAAWPVAFADDLQRLIDGGTRKVMAAVEALPHRFVDFDDPDAFFNVNTPADLAEAHRRAMAS